MERSEFSEPLRHLWSLSASPLQPQCPNYQSCAVQNFSDANVRENGKLSPRSLTFPSSAQHSSIENGFKVTTHRATLPSGECALPKIQ